MSRFPGNAFLIKIAESRHKKIFLSFFWGTLAALISQGLNFITNILIARILHESLGELSILVSATTALQTFSVFGLGTMATVLIAMRSEKLRQLILLIPSMYGLVLVNSIAISGLAMLINHYNFFGLTIWPNQSGRFIGISIAWLVFSSMDALQVGLIIGLNKFKTLAYVSLIRGIISILIIYPLVKIWGVQGGIAGYGISFFICSVISFFLICKEVTGLRESFSLRRIFNKTGFKLIIHYSFPIFVASFFISPSLWIANGIIFSRDSTGLALSTFAIVNQWMILIQFLPTQIAKVVLPGLAKFSGTDSFKKTDRYGLLTGMSIAVGISIFSLIFERFIIGLYGFDYATTVVPFRMMLLAGVFSTYNLLYGQSFVARGKTWIRAFADLLIAVTIILIVWYSKSSIILYSLPLAYLVSYVISSGSLVFMNRMMTKTVP